MCLTTLVCLGVETLQTCLLMIESMAMPPKHRQQDLQQHVLFKLRRYLKGILSACAGACSTWLPGCSS